MSIRPLESTDAPALHRLLTRPDVAAQAGTTPFDPPALAEARLTPPGGVDVHRFGVFEADDLLGMVTLAPLKHARARHVGVVTLVLGAPVGAPLLTAVADLAWRWSGFTRLECDASASDGLVIAALEESGYSLEYRKRSDRMERGRLVDALGFALFRPGWVRPPAVAAPPAWPPRAESPDGLRIRTPTLADAEDWADVMRLPEVGWGTLQLPSFTADLARTRIPRTDRAAGFSLVADIGGRVVGLAGLHTRGFPSTHTGGFGMGVAGAWQGRRVGTALLGTVLDAADWLGLRRIELEVYPDNTRAVALYQRHGFVAEGTRVAAAMRDGDVVDSVVMGRVVGDGVLPIRA